MISRTSELCPATRPLTRAVAPTVTALLDRLGRTPAFVTGPANDVLAWNDTWEELVGPLGMLERPLPNLARFVFLHPDVRCTPTGSTQPTNRSVAGAPLTGRWGDDEDFRVLMDELHAAPDFDDRWSKASTARATRAAGTTRIVHPNLGRLRLDYEVLLLPDDADEQRLVTWLPADDATAAARPAPQTGGSDESCAAPRHRLKGALPRGSAPRRALIWSPRFSISRMWVTRRP